MGVSRLGVDVGGTFTDVILVDRTKQRVWALKVPTTPDDPSVGVVNGIHAILKQSGEAGTDIGFVGHGTTIATNLLIEGKGARTALIATKGFRDLLEIRRSSRHDRADLYDMFYDNPPALVPRRWRREISARNRFDGTEIMPLDIEEFERELDGLRRDGIESVAVCLLHSYRNPDQERRVADAIRRRLPDVFVTTSYDVNPEIFEYERTSTTAINALLGPSCEGYLHSVEQRVKDAGVPASVHLMQSNGGLTMPAEAAQRPVVLLESGPAGGVTAAAKLCRRLNLPNAITGDIGGTSFDVSIVRNFEPELRQSSEISSYVVRVPTIDIVSIGAGGGSIASVDAAGGIRVGPRSAGAKPGPACYGRGGDQPTVTDCNLVLGYLSPDRPLGGCVLDVALARQAIDQYLAKPLKMSIESAARAVRSIANAHMAQAMRLVTIERGYDPREFVYIPFGGGGPIHAVEVAEMLEVGTIIVPPHPGLFSAFGMLVADMVHDSQLPMLRNIDELAFEEFKSAFAGLEAKALDRMRTAGIDPSSVTLMHHADCRYLGQADSINVSVPTSDGVLGDDAVRTLREDFMSKHQQTWNFTLDRPIMVTNLRIRAVGEIGEYETGVRASSGALHPTSTREVMLTDHYESISCYARSDFSVGTKLSGPAIIEEPSTSLVLGKGHSARVDADGNLVIELENMA